MGSLPCMMTLPTRISCATFIMCPMVVPRNEFFGVDPVQDHLKNGQKLKLAQSPQF
jgi:hypothetical protein